MPAGAIPAFEFALGLLMAGATLYAIFEGVAASAPFLLLFAAGYLYVGGCSLLEGRRRGVATQPVSE